MTHVGWLVGWLRFNRLTALSAEACPPRLKIVTTLPWENASLITKVYSCKTMLEMSLTLHVVCNHFVRATVHVRNDLAHKRVSFVTGQFVNCFVCYTLLACSPRAYQPPLQLCHVC